MENHYFAVAPNMVAALAGIGITVADHTLYLTVTSEGAITVVPVRQASGDGERNEYRPHQGNRPDRGARRLDPAVHGPDKQGLQGLPGAGRTALATRRGWI